MKLSNKSLATWLPVIIATSIIIGILLGSFVFGRKSGISSSDSFNKLEAILELVDENYVDSICLDSVLEKSFPDILAQLDPHSSYIPAEDLQDVNIRTEGSFSGIGIRFNVLTDTVYVDEVVSGGPCEKVGILPGDRIVSVNDTLIVGSEWTNNRLIKMLRGPRYSEVVLGVKRDNAEELLKFTVIRDNVPVVSVDASYMITPTTGYLKINTFSEETYAEFLTSLVQLKQQGAQNYILDLRGNGGGLMQAAVLMTNEFLSRDNLIVSMHGRYDKFNSTSQSNGLGAFSKEPLVVLIDETSASSSEILAGAIQDNDRGLIVGRRSFGKGLVQNQMDLPDNSAIRLTVARYYTPSGRCIQKDYTPGNIKGYNQEIVERYMHGEGFSADSMKVNRSQVYYTLGGREVYGGGGIIPDVFVPNDTLAITDYYVKIYNAGLLQKFSFKYTDTYRKQLNQVTSCDELLSMLPSDDILLNQFVSYAHKEAKIAPRWYYINQSKSLILDVLKALIARDMLGTSAYYEVINRTDNTVLRAIQAIDSGEANQPITVNNKSVVE